MLIEDHIKNLTKQEGCAKAASEILSRTAHLIKARSVAYGAAHCIFKARLVEAFGASGFFQSIIPGKGNLVHQILAIAFPRAFVDKIKRNLQELKYYVDEAEKLLEEYGMISDPSPNLISTAKNESLTMLKHALKVIPEIAEKIGLELERARVYAEMQLMSYKLHVWGVIDALVEDRINRKAIVIDWKTGHQLESKAAQISDPDIAQVCCYALLEADRLEFEDPRKPVLEGEIVPLIIRPRGNIPVASISPVYETMKRRTTLEEYLNNIILAAEHLTLVLSNVRRLIGPTFENICKFKTRQGRRASAFRYTPYNLPKGNPKTNSYRCKICGLTEECLFYIGSYEEPEEIDRLAWRSRYAIYAIRENALMPYKEIHEKISYYNFDVRSFEQGETFTLESGNRIDVFSDAEASEDGIILRREVREREIREERIISVREGRPVAVFFYEDVKSPLLRLSFVGRVDEFQQEEDEVSILVSAPNIPSRLHHILFKFYLENWRDLTLSILAVETNVDLTQMELRAIDAFQRGTKRMKEKLYNLEENLENLKNEALAILFGSLPLR
ncbi:conserved hypothetical protein [Ferroglobus placidus DSM 10642]|uniref:PD-(D/E)XK endonuclease-like domain-containing protein n=1 Tax=Ferroglobus placidus (strain DSM 10642 / AEDII12DO) TaxID=589924 RepID=D3RZ89_FERPA|nr:PD-(D/E)XK nuclease family protein [Ferroglobus placidus]ADC65802.1 conserved hypothetical protein [Ferroglobus placidus DSM 10642]